MSLKVHKFQGSQVPAFQSSQVHRSIHPLLLSGCRREFQRFRFNGYSVTPSIPYFLFLISYSLFPLGLSSPVQSPTPVPVPVGFAALRPRRFGRGYPVGPGSPSTILPVRAAYNLSSKPRRKHSQHQSTTKYFQPYFRYMQKMIRFWQTLHPFFKWSIVLIGLWLLLILAMTVWLSFLEFRKFD